MCASWTASASRPSSISQPASSLRFEPGCRAWRKKFPRRIPGVRLGRLAVDQRFQGKGLGELLLVDAMTRAQRIHAQAGGIGLFVDAIDEQAAGYYQRFGFLAVPDHPLLLFLPAHGVKD